MHVEEISEDFEIPWEHRDFTGRYYNPSLARACARINTGSKTNDDGVAAAEGKQLRGGICRAYSNRRQIKSASVRRARCCGEHGGISQFPSSPSIVPCILVECRPIPLSLSDVTGCISELSSFGKLLKTIAVLSTRRERERERDLTKTRLSVLLGSSGVVMC